MNRERFPAVMAADVRGRVLADNAAGAQLPDTALERASRFLTYDNAPKGHGFSRADATYALVAEAKSEFAALIDRPLESVGIGLNATSTALAFSRLVARIVRRGDRVVVTAADHSANVTPWTWLRHFGAQIEVIPVDERGDLDEAAFASALALDPVLVALPWASNATGTIFDVARYARAAKKSGALVVVDGVQALPHFALSVDPAIDLAFFSAYKVYAPHLGFWYLSPTARDRFLEQGDAQPCGGDPRLWTLEVGTQSHEALAGWLGTCAYLRDVAPSPREAMATLADYEAEIASYARDRFAERAPHVRLYGRPPSSGRLPLFAFNITGVPSDELAARFDRAGIEARVGDYLSPRLMQAVAPEAHGRAVRISFAHYTTTVDIDRCFDVVDAAIEREPEAVTS